MPPLEIILLVWLALLLGGAGLAFALLLLISVLVGGGRDLLYYVRDRVEQGRRSRGLCASCGYDLRFSPSRCPECGRWKSECASQVLLRYSEGSKEPARVRPVGLMQRDRADTARLC